MNKQPIHISKPLVTKLKVHHRSDLLMNEQVQHIYGIQMKLNNAIQELEDEKQPQRIQLLRLLVADLQAQAQRLILALKVMDKINTELTFARAALKEAIHEDYEQVNLCRKRVIWLEDKMEELCVKKKLNDIKAVANQDTEALDTELYKKPPDILEIRESNQLDTVCNHDEREITIDEQPLEASDVKKFHESLIETNETKNNLRAIEEDIQPLLDSKVQEGKTTVPDNNIIDGKKSEDSYEKDAVSVNYDDMKEVVNVYLTEVEGQNEGSVAALQSLDKSCMPETANSLSHQQKESEIHHDLGSEYWQSEHHRFEYSPFTKQFLEADPLSYHQVGLAVPGSFIQKDDIDIIFKELPWRARRKASEIKDVHRVALDKLATKIHSLYYKVYDATQLSVRSWNQLHDCYKDVKYIKSTDVSKSKTGSLVAEKGTDKIAEKKAMDEQKPNQKKNNYLKPLPPPAVLPITRTNWNKEYPRYASSFCKPDSESRGPAARVVDQRNLIEETKLNLYNDKLRRSLAGATRLEKKFQKMIANESEPTEKPTSKKLRTRLKAAVAMARLQSGANNWNQIKPESRGKEYSGLRWERVKTLVHICLQSSRVEERIDGARQLGVLRCGDTMVTYALKERINSDSEERVKYESAKSLILIGCWDEEVVECVLKFLVLGNSEIRSDLIQVIIKGKNVQFVNKTMTSVIELSKILSHFCQNPDPEDKNAFLAAVCLGQLCIKDSHAQEKLLKTLEDSDDSHIKAQALEILVKQLNYTNDKVVQHIEDLLKESPVWSYRMLACNLLIFLGPTHECVVEHKEKIYQLLERHLWDDPNMEVRLTSAKALTALGMFTRACESVVLKLEDLEEDQRAQAAIAVGTLGLKNEKIIRMMLEMLELDQSDYVRLMIIRTFRILKLSDSRVLRSLKEREKLDGAIGRECKKALMVLDEMSPA